MEITKFSSHFFVALEQATLHLRRSLNQLTERTKNAVEKMRELLAGSLDAAIVANAKITKFSSQLLGSLKRATLRLRQALNPLTERGKGALQKMPEILAEYPRCSCYGESEKSPNPVRNSLALRNKPRHIFGRH